MFTLFWLGSFNATENVNERANSNCYPISIITMSASTWATSPQDTNFQCMSYWTMELFGLCFLSFATVVIAVVEEKEVLKQRWDSYIEKIKLEGNSFVTSSADKWNSMT